MKQADCSVGKSIGFLIISIIILWQGSIASAQLLDVPLGDELYREVYDFIDRMVARQAVTKVLKNTLPYSSAEVRKILTELDRKEKEGQLKLSEIERHKLEQFIQSFSIFCFLRQNRTENKSLDLRAAHTPPETSEVSSSKLKGNSGRLFSTRGENHWFAIDFGLGEDIISRKCASGAIRAARPSASPSRETGQRTTKRQTAYATLFRPTALGQIRDDFAFYSDLKVYYLSTIQFPDIPKTEAKVGQASKKVATAALATYYLKFKLPWFEVFLGKDNLHWGPGRYGALLISENPLPMNMVKLTAQYYPVKFQAVTGMLGSDIARKYLSGHRVELIISKKLRLGVSEVIVYGERFETIYLNPVQIYTITEIPAKIVSGESKESPDNTLISGDFELALMRNLELYGGILIDDFRPFSYGLRSYRNWGSKFGLLFGFYYVDPFSLPNTDFRVEYAFINQYTYTHTPPVTAYTHFDSIIGHQIGTDADDLWFNLRHWFTPHFTMSLGYELERHGEGDVNKPHNGSDDDEWEFLSGVTESTHSIILGASYNLIGKYSFALEYTHFWIKNALNQDGVNDTNNQVLLSGQYRF